MEIDKLAAQAQGEKVMNANMDAFQALLAKMRDEFLCELPERCDRLDKLILALEKNPDNRDAFNELYRGA